MSDSVFFIVLTLGLILLIVIVGKFVWEGRKFAAMSPEEQAVYRRNKERAWQESDAQLKELDAQRKHGPISPQFICPHCQTRGLVRTKTVKMKKGISGGKATAALITGGLSVFATGLSRKEALSQAHCDNCNSTWAF